jgi:two-component system phosphate regulon sensor histidine kinase PhoR
MEGTPENPDLWRLTLQHSPIGMAMVGLDGRLLMVNHAMSEMLGYAEEDLTQRGFQELTHVDDLDADLALFDQALAGQIDSYRLRKRYLHADGHVVWGDLSVALVRGRDAQPLHFISQILDVTEQQEHEDRLRAATAEVEHERQSLEAIFETVSVGLLLIGQDGHYERMNRRHEETMRLPFPDGHAGEAGQLGHVYHPDGKTLMAKEDMPSYRATLGEEFDDYNYWVGDDPVTRRAFSTSARQVRGPSGEALGAALAYQDITDLMRAMQVKDEFVASVSHELRTPLTSVLGYLELLAENDRIPDDAVAHLHVVRRNAKRLQALLSDLLQVGEINEMSLQLHRDDVDLTAVVRESAEAARLFANQAGVVVELDLPAYVVALVDEQRIRQVLDNLLSNAVKYSREGDTVTVCLRQVADGVVLEVADTGIGIAPDEIDQVFGRFFRGGDALQRHIPGTGLGLNIVSSIVAAHGGEASLRSDLGRGTTFRVTLPHVTD